MSPVMVKLLASAALPASVLPSVVSQTRPCRAFRLVTLSAASPCAGSAEAATKTATTNRFKANACLELIPSFRCHPVTTKSYDFLVKFGLRLLHHSDRRPPKLSREC